MIAALAPEIATEVRDLLLSPPNNHPYDVLRAELLKRTAALEQRRLQQLLTAEELGDKQPSQLLRRMQQLLVNSAGPNPDNRFLRELFLQRLPNHVRMVLASAGDISLEALAQLADKIMEVATPTLSAVHVSPLASEVEQLHTEIALLKDTLSSLQLTSSQHHPRRSRSRSQAGSCTSSPAPTPTGDKPTLCWYHRRFNVNHSANATFESASQTINLGLRRTFRWFFLIADVKHPILGVDFLHHFNLLDRGYD